MLVDTATPAVILTLDRDARHHGGLGAIRSLGRLGVPVYGVHEKLFAPEASSRYLHGRWFWRSTADVERVQAGLATLADRIGRRAVLIPTDDAGAVFLAEHGAQLRQWFLFPDPPRDLPRRVAGKYTLYQLCRELGMPCVDGALPDSLADAEEFADRVGYPLVAKPATPWRFGGGSEVWRTSLVTNREELTAAYRAVASRAGSGPGGADLMLQEYIPRCPSQDYFFHGYCDARSRCQPGFVGIKERGYPADTGLTSLGRWVDNTELQRQATELLARLGFQGIVNLDYRWDPRDGQYKLLSFNPRLGAQFRLFSGGAGVDVVVASHLDLTGRPVTAGAQLTGRRFLVENYDPSAALSHRRIGELDLVSWVTSLRQVDEMAWFARDDLAPFGLMCLRMGARAITRGLTPRSTLRHKTLIRQALR
ncbi:MAG: carboxylate--amine ligase [Pseudonocardiaceae bacterium]